MGIRKRDSSKVVRLRSSVRPRVRFRTLAWIASQYSNRALRAIAARTPNTNFNVCLRELGQAARPISTGELRALQRFHIQPINLVVYKGPLVPCGRDT